MPFDTRLQTPFNMLIAGPSQSGKTTFITNLLKISDEKFVKKPDFILLFYNAMQPAYDNLVNMNLLNESININEIQLTYDFISNKVSPFKNTNGSLIIFDDTLNAITKDLEEVFQVLGHHHNCSLVYLTQNLYYNNDVFRCLSIQAHYIVLMRNRRNSSQIQYLSKQICPGNIKYLMNSYKDATQYNYTYLFIDCKANSPDELRLRTNIFPSEFPYTVFLEPQK